MILCSLILINNFPPCFHFSIIKYIFQNFWPNCSIIITFRDRVALIYNVIASSWHFFNSIKSSFRRWCTYGTGFDPRDTLKKYRELFSSHNIGIDPKSIQTDCSNVQQVVLPENHGFSAGAFQARPGRYLEPQPDRHTGEKFHKFFGNSKKRQVILFTQISRSNKNSEKFMKNWKNF